MTHQPKKKVFTLWHIWIAGFLIFTAGGCSSCGAADNVGATSQRTVAPESILDAVFISNNDTINSSRRKLIAIHGLGDSPENFADLFRDVQLSSTVILPRAPTSYGNGGSWFPVAIPVKSTLEEKLKHDVKVAAEQLCDYIRAYGFKRAPVVTGFSQGGILSFAIAVTCPDQITAAVPVSGFLPMDVPGNLHSPPIIAFHGKSDRIIDFDWGNKSIIRLRKANVSARMNPFEGTGHTITPDMHQKWISVVQHLLK